MASFSPQASANSVGALTIGLMTLCVGLNIPYKCTEGAMDRQERHPVATEGISRCEQVFYMESFTGFGKGPLVAAGVF
jgi:hypothetical protein